MRLPTLLHERVAILNAGIGRHTRSDEGPLFTIVGFGALSMPLRVAVQQALKLEQIAAGRKTPRPVR